MRFLRFFAAMLIPVISTALYAQEISKPELAAPSFYVENQEREYRFFPGGRISISMEAPGSLNIIGWDRGSVHMEAEIKVHSLAEEKARALLERSPIRIRYTNSASTIQVIEASELRGFLEINLTVRVPAARTDLVVQMKKGDFIIDTVNGWMEVNLAEGNMNLSDIDGYFSGRTQKGNIFASLSGSRWNGQGFTAVTQEGRIELLLPEAFSAVLQIDARGGEITVDYPPQKVEGELVPPEILVQRRAQQLRARLGDGGAPLRLGTQYGDASLMKK